MPQKIKLILRPKEPFDVPLSEGYQLYSALLNVMRETDPDAAERAHNSPISSISLVPWKAVSSAPNGTGIDVSWPERGMRWMWA